MYRQAQKSISAGNYDEGRALLEKCLELDARDAYCWLSLARLEARTSDAENARRCFEAARATCPDNVRLVHAHAIFEQRAGCPQVARQLFAEASEMDPANAYVSHAWGQLEEALGNVSAAQRIYADLMARRPQAQVCCAWAALEQHEGHVGRARAIYRQGWAVYGGDDGLVTQQQLEGDGLDGDDDGGGADGGDGASASASASTGARTGAAAGSALSADRDASIDLLLAWSQLERAAGNVSAARRLLQTARKYAPQSARVRLPLAALEAASGEASAARAAFADAVELPGAHRSDDGAGGFSELFNAWAVFEAKLGDVPAALEVLRRARKRYPRDPSLLQTLGTLQQRAGDLDGARASFSQSLAILPHAPTFVAYALLEASLGNIERARELFALGAAADPTHGPLHSARAKVEAAHGGPESAREVLREAVARFPSATLWHGWGKLEERQGNLEHAAELYGKGARASKGNDDPSYLWHSLGSVLLQQRRLPEALAAFENGLSRRPCSSLLLLGVAIVHGQMGAFDEGRSFFLRAVQADPSHAHAWQAWGVMEARLGHADVARDLYQRGLRRCPDHGALWQASAKLEAETGHPERARRLFRQGAERCPSHAPLLTAWAYYEMHQGKLARAQELLLQAETLDPHAGETFHVLSLLRLKNGKPREARAAVERGLEVAPTHAPLYRVLGAMQDVAGEVELARSSFKEGLRLNPGYAQLYHAWARLEGRLGNWDALSDLNKRAKAAFPSPVVDEKPFAPSTREEYTAFDNPAKSATSANLAGTVSDAQ
eukprot:jgi/Chrpa1/21048/Chrysochromulina_OHIO_Genome00009061-RA